MSYKNTEELAKNNLDNKSEMINKKLNDFNKQLNVSGSPVGLFREKVSPRLVENELNSNDMVNDKSWFRASWSKGK